MISLISSFEEDSIEDPHGLLLMDVGSLRSGVGMAAVRDSVGSTIDESSGLKLKDVVASNSILLSLASDLKLVLEVCDGLRRSWSGVDTPSSP